MKIKRCLDCWMREQNFGFGSKQESVIKNPPVQRLLTKPIPCNEQSVAFQIPQGKGKHAIKVLDHFVPIHFIQVRQYLGVGFASERVATSFQINPQAAIVVDFSVENDGDSLVFIENRLLSGNQINYGEASHSQGHA